MAKDYKQLKTQHVSGHVGSSLSDINSVSLSMPVPYLHHPLMRPPKLTVRTAVDDPLMVGTPIAYASVHTIHRKRFLHRSATELRHNARCDDGVLIFAMASQFLVARTSSLDIPHELQTIDF